MRLNPLLLLFLTSLQKATSQVSEWIEEVDFSGGKNVIEVFPAGDTEWIGQPDFLGDIYWSGTAPLCLSGCKARHQELRRDPCGDSSCCWLGYKSLCRVNCGKPDVDFNGMVSGDDWWVGAVLRYSCHPGFLLVGNTTRTCQANGLWTTKPSCLRMCKKGSIEISERELNGTCNATCAYKSYSGPPKQGCTQIHNCKKKETGWKRFFAQCVPCICDCASSCLSTG